VASLAPLLDFLSDERVQALTDERAPLTVAEPARPYLLASLVRHLGTPVLAVSARSEEAEHLARDVQAFLGREGAAVFPGWEVLPGEPLSPSVETMGRRLNVLARLQAEERFVISTTAQGMTQLVAPPPEGMPATRLVTGGTIDLDSFSESLVDMGYDRNYMVERRGEFARRGGILDIFPPAADRPLRVELWGDEITSLRQFALASQRSLEEVGGAEIAPCRELRPDALTRSRARALAATVDDPDLAKLAEGIVEPGAERLMGLL
jgi:transcription-repair coupling factor (superfamily II helicase)